MTIKLKIKTYYR